MFLSPFRSLKEKVLVAQSCMILCTPMNCSLPGSSVHGILQARILEWVAISSFRGSSWPRNQTWVSRITGIYHLNHQGSSFRSLLFRISAFQTSSSRAQHFLRSIGGGTEKEWHGLEQMLPLPIRAALLLLTYNYLSRIRFLERKEFFSSIDVVTVA